MTLLDLEMGPLYPSQLFADDLKDAVPNAHTDCKPV